MLVFGILNIVRHFLRVFRLIVRMREYVHRNETKSAWNDFRRAIVSLCMSCACVLLFSILLASHVTTRKCCGMVVVAKIFVQIFLTCCAVEAFLCTSFSGEIFVYSASPSECSLMMLLLMLLLLLLVVTPLLCCCQIHQKLLPSLFSAFPLFDVCKHFGVFLLDENLW